jgi:hypothetical protein
MNQTYKNIPPFRVWQERKLKKIYKYVVCWKVKERTRDSGVKGSVVNKVFRRGAHSWGAGLGKSKASPSP